MLVEVAIGGIAAAVSGVSGFLIAKKINSANFDIYLEQSKAKAKAIEHEAELILEKAGLKAQEAELGARKKYEDELTRLKRDYEHKEGRLAKKENALSDKFEKEYRKFDDDKKRLDIKKQKLYKDENEVAKLKSLYTNRLDELVSIIEKSAGLTQQEAKDILLAKIEERSRNEIAHIVRKYETEAKQEAKRKANFIIAQATTRFASEFAAERLINVVSLPDDELKGRIIGKEGRNIKALEMVLGVDIIIDETPNVIILSSFNLYRRAIATRTLELLIQDGRIQPARIEEIHEKITEEFEESILEEGEQIIFDMGLNPMHPELMKMIGKLKYRASYGQNALGHSLEVAHLAGIIAAELGGDETLAKRAGILHDIGKALTHDMGGSHVDLGADICKRYNEDEVVINAIYAHHGHEEVKSIECAAVCTADALSAARPGARREVLESFLKRVEEIEKIATSKQGVKHAYAINAGREIRVIANASLVNDDEAALIAKEVAEEIENSVQYPGEIKVNVIRELRSVEFAK